MPGRSSARYFTPRNASGTSATMMMALKMTADRIADCGVRRLITLSAFSTGNVDGEHRRNDRKVLGDVVGNRKRGQCARGS